jgi:hypothetical protein
LNKKIYQVFFALILTGATCPVVARALDYSFLSLHYSVFETEIPGYSGSPDGKEWRLDLSYELRPNFVAIAGYGKGSTNITASGSPVEASFKSHYLGVLLYLGMVDQTDFVITVRFFNGEIDAHENGRFTDTVDKDGGVGSVGVRSRLSDKFEINAMLHQKTVEDNREIGMSAGGSLYVTDKFTYNAEMLFYSDESKLSFGISRYF